ncbi:MAG: carboxypeptidase-like regulatory domain-containing protein [Candidatus Aminicenantales bacterium]
MRKSAWSRIATVALVVLLAAGLALAQAGRGMARLSGVVLDKDGKPVPQAKVTILLGQEGSTSFETIADKKGELGFMGIGTGNWTITASAKGYLPVSISFYVKQLEKNPKLTIKLEEEAKGSGIVQDESAFQILEQGNQFFKDGK